MFPFIYDTVVFSQHDVLYIYIYLGHGIGYLAAVTSIFSSEDPKKKRMYLYRTINTTYL